jgi:hypothetical protein
MLGGVLWEGYEGRSDEASHNVTITGIHNWRESFTHDRACEMRCAYGTLCYTLYCDRYMFVHILVALFHLY